MADSPTHIESFVMRDLADENEFLQLQSKKQTEEIEVRTECYVTCTVKWGEFGHVG